MLTVVDKNFKTGSGLHEFGNEVYRRDDWNFYWDTSNYKVLKLFKLFHYLYNKK